MEWFVLFVRIGSEENVVKKLKLLLDPKAYTPFVPTKAHPLIKKGKTEKEFKVCFPSYIFIRSPNGAGDFLENVIPLATRVKEAYYFLCYGDDRRDIAMREYERLYIERLMNTEFCMDGSLGFMDGDNVRIAEGPLVGMESQIKKINAHRRTAVLEVPMMGGVREITLMLEIVDKESKASQ